MSDIADMALRDIKRLIEGAGLDYIDCIKMSKLRGRV